jgi:plastocyanin
MKRLIPLALAAVLVLGSLALPAAAAGPTVTLKDNKFTPTRLTVKKGTKVTFRFAGKAPHNVTVKKGPAKFHSPTKKAGTYSVVLKKKGTYTVVCTLHSSMGMKMTLVVK